MSDKLTDCAIEAIGRLESLADNDIDSDYFAVVSNSESGQEVTEEYVITNVAAETAVLIKKLLAALKLEQEQSAYYERHMWDFHGLAESEIKRADAAEQRLQQPIKLPEAFYLGRSAENVKWMRAEHVKEAVRVAGYLVEDE